MTVSLPVTRESDFGYFLSQDGVDVLLHRNEATRPLTLGERVEVFLYNDHEDRLAATMRQPFVREGEYGWLDVVEVAPKLGVFLHNGIARDLLVFVDDLPKLRHEWPKPGDRLLVTLKRDKYGRLLGEPAGEETILSMADAAGREMLNQWVDGVVYKTLGAGALVFTEQNHILFIHRDEMTEPLRLGQAVRCRVSYVRDDGRLNGSMRERKEKQYEADARRLVDYLAARGGAMPYTDNTQPDVIRHTFGMSKAAFKRALGKLLKDGLIEQEESWTRLKREALDRWKHT